TSDTGIARDKDAVRASSGCYTCRIRRKKCDKQLNADGNCQTCLRLRLQCLGFGEKRPEWLRASGKVDQRQKIKDFLASQGMIKGHSGMSSRCNDQEPSILSLSADYASPSTSPQTPTLSIDDEHDDYIQGDTDARLLVMQDIDSPLNVQDNYARVIDQECSILTLSADYASLSPGPQSPTLSISSDEQHPGMARNDYLRGDTNARLPVMDLDSPLDVGVRLRKKN
ncbi:uncharacterized protein BJ212DRAFT_1332542, partial [Suillus subaureus]